MWGNTVWGGGACENPVEFSMYDGPMETVQYMWVNSACQSGLLDSVTKLQKYTPLACKTWWNEDLYTWSRTENGY